jgi:hypothetical protein
MKQGPNPKAQPEQGGKEDLNLTNRDASLGHSGERRQPDPASMSDQAGSDMVNGNLSQSGTSSGERNPEYGDAADPTFETM